MVESPQVTRLEASADVALSPRGVWEAILDGSRWPDWMASGDARGTWTARRPRLALDTVSGFLRPAGGPGGGACAVGDMRQESAVVARPFGLGSRRVAWRSVVTDIDPGRSIEVASPEVGGLREWRLRVNVLPTGVQPLPSWFRLAPPTDHGAGVRANERAHPEGARVQAILTYRPAGVLSRLYDRVSLRSMVRERLEAWIGGLARSMTILADLESRAVTDPVRYLPEDLRPAVAARATGPHAAARPPDPARDRVAAALAAAQAAAVPDPTAAEVAAGPGAPTPLHRAGVARPATVSASALEASRRVAAMATPRPAGVPDAAARAVAAGATGHPTVGELAAARAGADEVGDAAVPAEGAEPVAPTDGRGDGAAPSATAAA